ncbi:hypothetical protein RclHR1_34600002 [Rhizophagus clarus]|uniref:Uncharacterized protein n=1 Tax=Rhizophagus clarus TaxID=94130 RepID=A0A2Z6RA89_9GLOM|nr:hypothetical protein RclHR1_34600002 [Rhizophagus clarus]GES93877.1 hypothetical protein RCL_e15462_RclHR1_34600002 [Rhizophagus clarus]
MYTDIAKFLDVFSKWVENWLNAPIKETGHTVNASIERTDIFQIHEIACNIIYHLDQFAEEDYWKAVEDYKNANHAYIKYPGTNKIITKKSYKEFLDLADKKEKAFAYQVEIEKIMLQGRFVYKKEKEKKDRIINNIRMLADGLDPYEILASIEEANTTVDWQDYWEDEDSDDPTNWQSEYSENPSDSNEDPDYPYLKSVEWI